VKGAATRQALMLATAYFDVTIGTDNQSILECCHRGGLNDALSN
jgi:hypothetical protein